MPGARRRVLLAMSGGVDSSAAAVLLQEAGYEVVGMTLQLLPSPEAARAVNEARDVCARLGIEHHAIPYETEFSQAVIKTFCQQYLDGKTPNPCIECNRCIKFAALMQLRCELDCDFMATGHYAQTAFDEETGRYLLLRAEDRAKDQSYVLFNLSQQELACLLLPLGGKTKAQIRQIAADAGFANAQKPESQDICFIPNGDYASFILEQTQAAPCEGPIVNRAGRELGTHTGLLHYTIGQRKGIGVAAPEPLYVFEKRTGDNTLVVDTAANTLISEIVIGDLNCVALDLQVFRSLAEPLQVQVKTHYRQNPQPASVMPLNEQYARIVFTEPLRACAPGQAAVCYLGDSVALGGIIA